MTRREIFDMGRARGHEIGSLCAERGNHDHFIMECAEAEGQDRQYSPFDFTAKELNDLCNRKPYDVWTVFEDGINRGFEDVWKERQ